MPLDVSKIINKVLKDIHKGKGSNVLNKDLLLHDFNSLNDGLGKGLKGLSNNVTDFALAHQLRRNIGVFSAFKNHQETRAIVELITDSKGDIVPFRKFRDEALKISDKYNKVWLQTEYDTAIRRANIATRFQQFEETKDLYPNLEWTPSRSANPRADHEAYYGMIRSVDDPFWNENFPGMLWGCKCGLAQTKERETDLPLELVKAPSGLDGNPQKTGNIFALSHPYFKGLKKEEIKALRSELDEIVPEIPYPVNPTFKSKGKLYVHPFAEPEKKEFIKNFESAQIIAKKTKSEIRLRYHIGIDGVKNPDYEINGLIADLKENRGKGVSSSIGSAIKQGCEVIVFHMRSESPYNTHSELVSKVYRDLIARVKDGLDPKTIKHIYIIDKAEDVHLVDIKLPKMKKGK